MKSELSMKMTQSFTQAELL
jgi:Ran GTPase-activating protein (RanGAP) involved in mRNA processing and transport